MPWHAARDALVVELLERDGCRIAAKQTQAFCTPVSIGFCIQRNARLRVSYARQSPCAADATIRHITCQANAARLHIFRRNPTLLASLSDL
jgi:hypothetical protein